jgi:hypothetical protein
MMRFRSLIPANINDLIGSNLLSNKKTDLEQTTEESNFITALTAFVIEEKQLLSYTQKQWQPEQHWQLHATATAAVIQSLLATKSNPAAVVQLSA